MTLPRPIEGCWTALDEPSFRHLFVELGLSKAEVGRRFSVSSKTLAVSCAHWGPKFAEELRRVRKERRSRSMQGNSRGSGPPSVVLDPGRLREMAEVGMSVHAMARALGCSEFLVRRNLTHHRVEATSGAPKGMTYGQLDAFRQLEKLHPGMLAALAGYTTNPQGYWDTLYAAFLRLSDLLWLVKDHADKAWHWRVETGQVARSHVCWRVNRGEQTLALALMDAGIPHQREVEVAEGVRTDFFFPTALLCVEVDGSAHALPRYLAAERRQARLIRKRGWTLMRFTVADVVKDTARVVSTIAQFLSRASSQ